ncbi:MAG: hypothetical protein Q9202_006507 [Teloschistes flavicans]
MLVELTSHRQVQEISIDYSDCQKLAPYDESISTGFQAIPSGKVSRSFKAATCPDNGVAQWKRMNTTYKYRNFTPQEPSTMCSLQFTVPHELDPPVFLYYRLTNFYQNHRRYVKSLDTNQLKGDAVSDKTIGKSNCNPLRLDEQKKPYYPCGLIANSLFNDSFAKPLLLNVEGKNQMNQTYNMTNKGIAWDSDRALYGQTKYKPQDIAVPPNWKKQYPDTGYSEENPPPNLDEYEEFQVWMRTAGLPAFSKLSMRNDKEKMACGTYQLDIIDNFNVTIYGGTKSILISTSTVMGGKNPFLGIAYIVVGGLCIVLGALFTITHLIKPRKLGDHTYLTWNNDQPSTATTSGFSRAEFAPSFQSAILSSTVFAPSLAQHSPCMLASIAFALLTALESVQAHSAILGSGSYARSVELSMCDTQQPNDALRSIHSELSAQKKLRKVKTRDAEAIVVDTYFHFVVANETAAQYTPDKINQLATAQLDALNLAYAPTNVAFNLHPTTLTVNTTWATNSDDTAMKSALRSGTYSTLNIYFQSALQYPIAPGSVPDTDPSSFLLGTCGMPSPVTVTTCIPASGAMPARCTSTSTAPTSYIADGCNVLLASMPGGGMQEYDQGKTAVHEVGHWFGLLHTFQDTTCASSDGGDYIDDTPQEATSTSGCPVGKDSCPASPGVDPVNNYMDYSSDAW